MFINLRKKDKEEWEEGRNEGRRREGIRRESGRKQSKGREGRKEGR